MIVIGVGAVGGSIAGLLANAGLNVEVVARGPHGLAIREHGLIVRKPECVIQTSPICHEKIENISWDKNDIAIVATKLNDAESVFDQLLSVAGAELPVVCASNGVQGEIWACERFQTVLSMLVWMPSTHLEPGDIRLFGGSCPGVLDVGVSQGDHDREVCQYLVRSLNEATFDSKHQPNIAAWKNTKWISNLANAAQALVVDDWKSVADAAREEGSIVLDAAKFEQVDWETMRERTAHIQLKSIDGEERQGGSTWQSRQRGKPLESRWIEGAIADLAESVGIRAPVNRFLSDVSCRPRDLTAEEVLNCRV